MVQSLKSLNFIDSDIVADVMSKVDRADFTDSLPYDDNPTPFKIEKEAKLQSPQQHAIALELLKNNLIGKTRALDIGSGSGYLAVCMSLMMEGGFTYGIENQDSLFKKAIENIKKNHGELIDDGRTVIIRP